MNAVLNVVLNARSAQKRGKRGQTTTRPVHDSNQRRMRGGGPHLQCVHQDLEPSFVQHLVPSMDIVPSMYVCYVTYDEGVAAAACDEHRVTAQGHTITAHGRS